MKNLSPEEAVRILGDMMVKSTVPRAAETQIKRNAALEMAIKALATDINVGDKDTISRAKAIDAIDDIESEIAEGLGFEYEKWRKYFCDLPPARPERIIHCKDCEWWTKQDDSLQGRCALMGMYPTGGWFCGNARMREVADGNHN